MGISFKHILTILTLFISMGVFAQTTPQVHKINGSKYYLHVVEQGNTLYGISRLYEVSIDVIQKENSDALRDGLKVNQTLLIPVNSDNKKELAPVEQDGAFLNHTVRPSETLYAVSRQYNVKLEEILKENPLVATEGLKAGSVIKIPIAKADVLQKDKVQAKPDSLLGHVVRKGETLFSIKTKYDVSMTDLLAANPGLDLNIREGSVIRIPGTSVKKKKPVVDTTKLDSIPIHVPDSVGSFNVGLLIPLSPSFPDSSNRNDFKIKSVSRIALEYYRGFEFAIDSLDDKYPVGINLKVYSVDNDSFSMAKAYQDPDFDSLDVIIGPFYTSQFESVADKMLQKGVIAICPINKPSKLLFKRPNAVKMVPSESMQINSLAEFLATELKDSNLVLVNSNKFQDTQNIEFFKERFASALNVPDTFTDDVIREIKLWDIDRTSLKMRFPDTGDYILVVPSKDQVFVTKLLNGLYDFAVDSKGTYRFQVFGLSEWSKWVEGLNVRQLQKLHVTLPLPNHIDFNDTIITQFYQHYYNKHGFEPTDFTLQGFDLCHYLFQQLSSNPTNWFRDPSAYSHTGVLNNIEFARMLEDSGVENTYVRFYQYDSFQLNKIGEWPSTKSK